MEIDWNLFMCGWCAKEFVRHHPTGRKPTYCGRTCRQRAHEARRRAAYLDRLPAPEVAELSPLRRTPLYYESSRNGMIRHALRPEGPPDRLNRRPTLCGAWAPAGLARLPFPGSPTALGRPCRVCVELVRQFPPEVPLNPPVDLATIKHLLLGARRSYLDADLEACHTTVGRLLRRALGDAWEARVAPPLDRSA